MQYSKIVRFLCTLLFMTSFFAKGQETDATHIFEYISAKEGLSHNYVSKIVSDSLNVKWIATENGVTRYDGLNFSSIQPGSNYPALQNENIETLFVDSHNNLWIGTKSGGVSKLDIATDVMENYNSVLDSTSRASYRVRVIEEDVEGNIWIATHDHGIFMIDPTAKKVLRNFKSNHVSFILKDTAGNMWFNSFKNIKKYSPVTKKMDTYYVGQYIPKAIEDRSRNCIWIVGFDIDTKKSRLNKLDLSSYKITEYPTNLPNSMTASLYMDKNQRLWIGTWGAGLYEGDESFTKFHKKNLVYPPDTKKVINYDIVLDIHEDRDGVLWIASDFGGIVKITENKGFQNIDRVVQNKTLQNEMNFHSIFHDDNDIYLGTLRSGLFYGKDLQHLKQLKGIEKEKIYTVAKHDENLLVGAQKGVYIFNRKRQLLSYSKINQTTAFLSENDSTLWVGTQQNGLRILNINSLKAPKTIIDFDNTSGGIRSKRITQIVQDHDAHIWVGTYNGLHLYLPEQKRFKHHSELLESPLPNIINAVYIDDSYLWLATPKGLFKLMYKDEQLQVLKTYTTDFGLSSNFICGITTDSQGFLWLTTPTNLIRFDPLNESAINFSKNDGVYTTIFNYRTIVSNKSNGMIYAGGTNNLTYFNPENIHIAPYQEKILFSQLKVNHQEVLPNRKIEGAILLQKSISLTKAIELTHKHSSFSVSFTNTNFNKNTFINYRYRLIGFEDDWVPINNKNEVSFAGLGAGNYELQLAASSDASNWSEPIVLNINIKYAPWKSPLAYALYFLCLAFIISGFVYVLMKQLHLKSTLEKEQELSEAKFTFFTNISHEFRTPLTLILSPLKELLQRKEINPKVAENLVTMEKNADRLLNLINQLLDFRKAEHGLLKLQVSEGNIVRFSNEVFLYFQEQANAKQIDYQFESSMESIRFPFDRNKMEIVLSNLISNALKYSGEGSKIKLSISATESSCVISIKDNGIGMNKESKKKIFDRFYQIKSTNTSQIMGSGIGLTFTKKIVELHGGTIEVESQLNQGTEFLLDFPLDALNYMTANFEEKKNSDTIAQYKELEQAPITNLNISAHEQTILVVDDNDDIRNYLTQLLKDNYNVLQAKDGVEGVEMAIEEMPDLILCDIMMPRKDGLAVSKELKTKVSTSHIPIILLTARSSNMYEIQGLETGADDFITKPFDPQVVMARIASALQNRSNIREHFLNKVRFEPTTESENIQDPDTIFIEKAIKMVEDNLLNSEFDIKTMVDNLHMSQSSLYRKIKSLTGLSLTGFMRSIRLKKAAEMILTQNEKLSTVALSVGFNDYKYFRQSFKKQFGCLPSEYKNIKK